MPLSAEDALRLNVMLANQPQAVRIDESRMQVWSLSEAGEACIELCANCRDDKYLRQVRELLSGHVLGSPGGYPLFISRWTRMGQMRSEHLANMLLIGEPEAVVAVVHAEGLTDELARRAWWIMQDAENARQMLSREAVVQGNMGRVLAQWLVEFLPFETEPQAMMETVRLVLQDELLEQPQRDALWKKSRRKPAYYLGFLAAIPDRLPVRGTEHPQLPVYRPVLQTLAESGNPLAGLLLRSLSAHGQAWLDTLLLVMDKPANQDVVNALLDITADYFCAARSDGRPDLTLASLQEEAAQWLDSPQPLLQAVLAACPELRPQLRVLRLLSGLGYGVVRPVFRDSSAIGSLMRRKLEPVFQPLRTEIRRLQSD